MKIFRICFCQQGFTTKAYASKLYLFTWGKKGYEESCPPINFNSRKNKSVCLLEGGC